MCDSEDRGPCGGDLVIRFWPRHRAFNLPAVLTIECKSGKHENCYGDGGDHTNDRPMPCPCVCHTEAEAA